VEADRRTYIEAIYTELNAAGDAMADDAQASSVVGFRV
jgi:hypothetical protein